MKEAVYVFVCVVVQRLPKAEPVKFDTKRLRKVNLNTPNTYFYLFN